jgi:hypothetical protein
MTNDEARARTVMRTSDRTMLWAGLLAGLVGVHCSSGTSSIEKMRGNTGTASPDASEGIDAGRVALRQDAATLPASATGTGSGLGSVPPGADAGGSKNGGGGTGVCVSDYDSCFDGGLPCCGPTCTNGYCGSCGAEGVDCTASPACCDGLTCMPFGDAGRSYCGTNLCVPNGSACGGESGATCCADNCVNGVCAPNGN